MPILHRKNLGDSSSKLGMIQTTMTSIQIEKFTGDWLQKWKVKDMEITLDRHDTIETKNKNTESYKKRVMGCERGKTRKQAGCVPQMQAIFL